MAPAVLLMTTCFVRIMVVLGLLRQAMGTQSLPPSQVITSIALFMTLLVMTPVWKQVYDTAIKPYTDRQIGAGGGLDAGGQAGATIHQRPDRTHRQQQRRLAVLSLSARERQRGALSYDDVPLSALLPAFMLSELKTAFLIGFQIYLPFLVLDIVVATVMVSMGMMMLPPSLVSLPFKLLLFVLVDGWHLVVGMLLDSFQPFHTPVRGDHARCPAARRAISRDLAPRSSQHSVDDLMDPQDAVDLGREAVMTTLLIASPIWWRACSWACCSGCSRR